MLLSTVCKERPVYLNLPMSLALHRSTLDFKSGLFCEGRCNDFIAAQHHLSNILLWNNLGTERPATFLDDLIATLADHMLRCSRCQDVFDLVEHVVVLIRAGHRFCRKPKVVSVVDKSEAKTTLLVKCQCNAMRICCAKEEWKILHCCVFSVRFARALTCMFLVGGVRQRPCYRWLVTGDAYVTIRPKILSIVILGEYKV